MNSDIQTAFVDLLEHHCSKCSKNDIPGGYRTFHILKEHMRREHELHYCDLCVENLKIFTFERRCYTRPELAQHRRKGDLDDKSHKGHPICEFCDTRYMDPDELYRHLRRDHLYCHFCDADGFHHYYSTYNSLRDHFEKEHYLCEEGDCVEEEFTSVFRTEIDLKAHRASTHCRGLGKAATKQARTLEVEFTLAPRPRPDQNRGAQRRPPLRNQPREDRNEEGAAGFDTGPVDVVPVAPPDPPKHSVDPLNCQDFPSLGGGNSIPRPGNVNIRHTRIGGAGLARTNENFPALGAPDRQSEILTPSHGAHVRLSVNTNGTSSQGPSNAVIRAASSNTPNVSIHVSNRANGGVTITNKASKKITTPPEDFPSLTPVSLQGVASKHRSLVTDAFTTVGSSSGPKVSLIKKEETVLSKQDKVKPSTGSRIDFPALGDEPSVQTNPQWLSQKPKKQPKVTPAPVVPPPTNFTAPSDFPSLNKSQKKKTVSVTVPVSSTSSWNEVTNDKNKSKKKKTLGNNNSSPNDISNKREGVKNNSKSTLKENIKEEDNSKAKKDKKSKLNVNQTNNNTERKRSEIKINSLKPASQETNNSHVVEQNNSVSSLKQEVESLALSAPPGFNDIKGPPPGFGAPPPPGFSVKLNSVARPQSNGLTFISSSGRSYSILPGTHNYNPPHDFDRRNKILVEQFKSTLPAQETMASFLNASKLFREGTLPAQLFYDHCCDALGVDFITIFPELLALLPDITKQQELYLIYCQNKPSNGRRMDVCATCRQVVLSYDFKSHLLTHSMENQFPALGESPATNNVWKK